MLGAGVRHVRWASLAAQAQRRSRCQSQFAKAQEIADAVGPVVKVLSWDQREDALDDIALLANATSLGMAGKPPLEISLDRLPKNALVGDLIYIPPETQLLAAARMRGNITVNGLGLLLNQARPAFNRGSASCRRSHRARQAIAATSRRLVVTVAISKSRRSTATCTSSIPRAFRTAPTPTTRRRARRSALRRSSPR